ncbi:MAG: hypothetical protein KAY24_15320 [Candidatus Eisenbacteria sp.]|nr:hypothetical protein [Candidatus Eisenbacteria bacterium]
MRLHAWIVLVSVLLLAGTGFIGCSDDSSTNSGGNGNDTSGKYLIEGTFANALISGGSFAAYVGRLDAADASAKDCTIDVNGTNIPLMTLLSTDEDAVFTKLGFGYEAGTSYTVTATLASKTATCSFVGPEYNWPEITAPADNSGFTAGESIDVAWQYGGGTPEKVYVRVYLDSTEEDYSFDKELSGETTSYTIPGSETSAWTDEEEIIIGVDLGEGIWPITGDLASVGSFIATILPGDAISLVAGGSQTETWFVDVTLDSYSLDADGASTTQMHATIQDSSFAPCPDGTTVIFSVTPAGYVAFNPTTATTSSGEATTTITAASTAGDVSVCATAFELVACTNITLQEVITITVGTSDCPEIDWNPGNPMYGLIVREVGIGVGNTKWTIVGGVGGFTPEVTYGTVPNNATQAWPLLGVTPDPLDPGTEYKLGLVDAVGDTLFCNFTP